MKTKDLALCGVFAALTAVISQISVPLPITPIPITLGYVAVFLCGGLQRPLCAFLSQAVYLAVGAAGAPVFAGFQGGLGRIFGPTGGYLLAYPFMALLVSLFFTQAFRHGIRKRMYPLQLAAALGTFVTAMALGYVLGTFWFSLTAGISLAQAATKAVLPFLPLDLVKAVSCSFFLIPARARLDKALGRAQS